MDLRRYRAHRRFVCRARLANRTESTPELRPRRGAERRDSAGRHGWLYFIDADDWAEPTLLARMIGALEADPSLDAVHCGWAAVAADGRVIEEDRYRGTEISFPPLPATAFSHFTRASYDGR